MKKSESGILVLLYLILIGFILYFTLQSGTINFADAETKKTIFLFGLLICIIITAKVTKSVLTSFVIFFPVLTQINKVLFEISDFLTLPPVLILAHFDLKIIGFLMIIFFIILFDFEKLLSALKFKPVLFYTLFIISGLFTIVWSMDVNSCLAYLPTIIQLPVAYYVFLQIFEQDEKNVWYACWGLIIAALISILFIWPDYFGIEIFSSLVAGDNHKGDSAESVRARGLVGRSAIALILLGLIPFCYNFGIYYLRKYRTWVHLAGFMLILTLMLTLGRMVVAASLFGTAILMWYAIKQKVLKVNIAFIVIGVIAFGALAYFLIDANGNSVEAALTRDTWDGRVIQFNAGFMNLIYSYGFGIGMNNFLISPISRSVMGPDAWNFKAGTTLHNDYIRIACEYGLAGIFFYATFLISTFKAKNEAGIANALVRGAKINIAVMAISGLTDPTLNHDTTLIFCGIYLAIIKYYKNKSSPDYLLKMATKYS